MPKPSEEALNHRFFGGSISRCSPRLRLNNTLPGIRALTLECPTMSLAFGIPGATRRWRRAGLACGASSLFGACSLSASSITPWIWVLAPIGLIGVYLVITGCTAWGVARGRCRDERRLATSAATGDAAPSESHNCEVGSY